MKKFFAIALAMAMVLSLGTALAATWGNNGANTATPAAVTISVTKYIVLKDAANQSYFSRLDDAAIVKAGDKVAFQVKISVPSVGSLNNQFGTTVFHEGDALEVKIEGTNLEYASSNLSFTPMISLTADAQTRYLQKAEGAGNGSVSAVASSDLNGTTNNGMYLDVADAYGAVGLKVNVRFTSNLDEITIKSGDYKFKVEAATGGYRVYSDNYLAGASVYFRLDSNKKVSQIDVVVDTSPVMKVIKSDGIYQCDGTGASAAQKFAGDDFLNKVLSLLGFSAYDALYSGVVYMDNINWAQNFGVYFNNSNNATYAPYTPVPVTVTPVTTTTTIIPKTGSNASIIGYAMVALAVVAAAVVAVRKVRA